MPLVNMKQVQGGKELQGNVNALLNIIGKDKDAFFNEILNWLLSEAPQDFNPEILKSSKLAMLVSSAVNVNNKPDAPSKTSYLSFIEENGEAFTLKGGKWDGTMEYSIDTENWSTWDGTEINSSNSGELYLRGTGNTVISNVLSRFRLTSGKRIQCLGNIENLLDYATVSAGNHPVMGDSCFEMLFYGCTSLTVAPELPATTLTTSCYSEMFENCTSLIIAPDLPALVLEYQCYNLMFKGCTSLTTAPELPATTLANSCYRRMFNGCSALTKATTNLPAATLQNNCYDWMFLDCNSFTNAIHFPASLTTSDRDYISQNSVVPSAVYDL